MRQSWWEKNATKIKPKWKAAWQVLRIKPRSYGLRCQCSTTRQPPDDHQSSCTTNGTYWVVTACATEAFMQCSEWIVRSLHIVFCWSWDEKDYHVCLPEEVGRGWLLWNILPRVITNWLFVSQRASVLASHREGPHFSNQSLRLGPVVEKAKTAFIQNQLVMTRGILFHKGQPCPTSSVCLHCKYTICRGKHRCQKGCRTAVLVMLTICCLLAVSKY